MTTPGNYTYTSTTTDVTGGLGTLTTKDQTDNDNDATGGFAAGTHSDTQWDAGNNWLEVDGTAEVWSLPDNNSTTDWVDMTNNALLLHLDEASGALTDSSSNSNTGTNSGATYSAAGKFNTSLNLDGQNDYISIADDNSLDFTSNFTAQAWFKFDSLFNKTADYNMGLLDKGAYQLYFDKSDGKLKFNLTDAAAAAIATSYNGSENMIPGLGTFEGKLYAGQGNGNFDGDIYVYDGNTWSVSYNGSEKKFSAFAVYNNKLYAGQGGGAAGAGDIYVFDGTSWTISHNGAQEEILSLAVYNGKLYAGQADDPGDGDILEFDGTTWSTSYNGAEQEINSMVVYNNKLYAGQSGAPGAGNGDIYVYDGATWSLAYDAPGNRAMSLAVFKGELYISQLGAVGDGDVYKFDGTT